MQAFNFYSPTRVIFGKGVESQAGEQLAAYGATKVLIHYGSGSVVRSGLLERVKHSLDAAGIAHVELGGVLPNPRLSLVRTAAELCKKEGVDFILAVGGGSVIDSSKAASIAVAHPERDVWDFYIGKAVPSRHLPVGSILTIAAAGSEMSDSCVITNEDGLLKRGLNGEYNRPVFALLNPELLYTLPVYQIACGVADIMMHTLERFFSPITDSELTDQLAEGLLRTTIRYGKTQVEHPDDYKAASELMWAGSISHNQLTGLGNLGDWATHQFGHEVSAMYDAAHGATLTAVWPSWARYVCAENPARFARLATNVWGIDASGMTDAQAAAEGIAATERYFASLGMPTNLPALIGRPSTEEELLTMAQKCSFDRTREIGSFKKLPYEMILEILRTANNA